MPRFMLLLQASTTARPDLPPGQVQAIVSRYVTWSADLRARGHAVSGEKLRDRPGRVLTRDGVRDGPFAEAKEVLGGFYLLEARDLDEAVALARTSPHLELGGTIVVREVEEV